MKLQENDRYGMARYIRQMDDLDRKRKNYEREQDRFSAVSGIKLDPGPGGQLKIMTHHAVDRYMDDIRFSSAQRAGMSDQLNRILDRGIRKIVGVYGGKPGKYSIHSAGSELRVLTAWDYYAPLGDGKKHLIVITIFPRPNEKGAKDSPGAVNVLVDHILKEHATPSVYKRIISKQSGYEMVSIGEECSLIFKDGELLSSDVTIVEVD